MEKLKKIKDQVEYILIHFPDTRNCDLQLTIRLWTTFYSDLLCSQFGTWRFGVKQYVRLINIFKLPREDHVSRIRREFNQEHLYLPTDQSVAEKRKINIENWKKFMSIT